MGNGPKIQINNTKEKEMIISALVGAVVGGLVVGVIANRRPQWFAKGVAVVNQFDDKVNAKVADATAQVKAKL